MESVFRHSPIRPAQKPVPQIRPINWPQRFSQRGEISTIITAVAVVVFTVAVAVGATRVQVPDLVSRFTKAQQSDLQRAGSQFLQGQQASGPDGVYSPLEGSCRYQSSIFVFKEQENIFFSVDEIGRMRVVNDRGGALQLDQQDRTQNDFSIGEFPFDPKQEKNYARGDLASLTLEGFDRSKWRVKSFSCVNRGVRGCPEEADIAAFNAQIARKEVDGAVINGFKIDCEVDVTYSWVLTQEPSLPTPTPTTPTPTAPTPTEPTETPTPASCPFTSSATVHFQSKGSTLSLEQLKQFGGDVIKVKNNRNDQLSLNKSNQSANSFSIDPMPFDETGVNYFKKGAPASAEIVGGTLPSSLRVREVYCEDKGGTNGCPTSSQLAALNTQISQGSKDGRLIEGFKVDCNVNTDYGWIVEPNVAGGSMEVRVEALNFPQKTNIWDKDHVSSSKPGSCTRQQSGEQRPLYLNKFKVRATCVDGECKGTKPTTITVDEKRVGYARFVDMPAGSYTLKVYGDDLNGYEMWEPCGEKVWTVERGKTTQEPVVMLANLKDGIYDKQPTEKQCKEDNGAPNLIQGLDGNVCYYKDGKKKDDGGTGGGTGGGGSTGSFDEECKKLENGVNGICVGVLNSDPGLKSTNVFLNPLLQKQQASFENEFSKQGELKVMRFNTSSETDQTKLYSVIMSVSMKVNVDKSLVRVRECSGQSRNDSSGRVAPGSKLCYLAPARAARVLYELAPTGSKPDKPDPIPTPIKKYSVPYTIPLRTTNVDLRSDYVEFIGRRKGSKPYAKKIFDAAVHNNWNPALLLALWIEETGASARTMIEVGGSGQGRPLSTGHLGCNPGQKQTIDDSLRCFFGPPRTNLKDDQFPKFAHDYCGPALDITCSNNKDFLPTLGKVYDDLVFPGSFGSRRLLVSNFPTLPAIISDDSIQIGNVEMNEYIAQNSSSNVTLFNENEVLFGIVEHDNNLYLNSSNKNMSVEEILTDQLLPRLGLTKNESCNLNIIVDNSIDSDELGNAGNNHSSPSFCSSPAQQDLNEDEVVNGFDFAQCFVDAEVADEAERAFDAMPGRGTFAISTGQTMESLYELDLPCDFNVNRRIDALDISKMIQVMTESK